MKSAPLETPGADHACLVRLGKSHWDSEGEIQKFNIRGPGTTLFDTGFGFRASRCKGSAMKRPNRAQVDPFPAMFSHAR